MSRILRRPMFRGGRVESKGDLKVIDQMGIANLATGGRVGFEHGGSSHETGNEIQEYTDIIEAVRASRPKRKGMSTSDYLRIASAGADILSAPSEGSGIFGALRSASPALSKLGTDMATGMDTRAAAEESAITDISGAIMKSRNYRPDRGFALDAKLLKLRKTGERAQQIQSILTDTDLMGKYILENAIEGETDAEKFDNASKILNDELALVKNDLKLLLPKDEMRIAFLKSGRAGQFFNSFILAEEKAQGKKQSDIDFDWNAVLDRASSGNKDGGIIGYAEGGLTEMVSEEVSTPEGTEMEEEVMTEQTTGSSAPLTYEQLRQRLPKEIPDDVIKLIASSDEALLAFSNIATQQDVDEFNVKYGVELVLPQG
jgi:hypothetical protein